MEISRLRDVQPDRERSKGAPPPRRDRRAATRKAAPDASAPESTDAEPELPTEPPHRIDVTA